MSDPIRIVKLGGSLLHVADLSTRLSHWLRLQSPATTILIVGGGRFADVIRELDTVHTLGDETTHWLCIRQLDITAQVLASLVPQAAFIRRVSPNEPLPPLSVLSVEDFMRDHEPSVPGAPLHSSWRSTTDSIAARVATYCTADELVLLKSCPFLLEADYTEAARQGLVDEDFPAAARDLTVRWVNLLDDGG
jgi:aspartokinase-like uncharacterized kinase